MVYMFVGNANIHRNTLIVLQNNVVCGIRPRTEYECPVILILNVLTITM